MQESTRQSSGRSRVLLKALHVDMATPSLHTVRVTSCDKENLGCVLKLQKRAARVISNADNQASSVKLFNRLQWLPFYEESKIAKCCVAYKRIKGEVPLYTENSLILNSQQHNRATGYSNTNFICPRFNRMTEGRWIIRSYYLSTLEQLKSKTQELCIIRIF